MGAFSFDSSDPLQTSPSMGRLSSSGVLHLMRYEGLKSLQPTPIPSLKGGEKSLPLGEDLGEAMGNLEEAFP